LFNDQADFASSLYWYDRLGRMVVSQNTKQFNKSPNTYSYTKYDPLNRNMNGFNPSGSINLPTNGNQNGTSTPARRVIFDKKK
jgi:hypothetical protein